MHPRTIHNPTIALTTGMRPVGRRRAFTLLELVLVMIVISTALAIVAPSLGGWNRGMKLRDASEHFIAMTQWARSQAIVTATTHRLTIDAATGSYQVTQQNNQEFAVIPSEFGREFTLPEGVQMQLVALAVEGKTSIDFFPTGRCQTATVRFSLESGESIDVLCDSPAEGFRIPQPGETR